MNIRQFTDGHDAVYLAPSPAVVLPVIGQRCARCNYESLRITVSSGITLIHMKGFKTYMYSIEDDLACSRCFVNSNYVANYCSNGRVIACIEELE